MMLASRVSGRIAAATFAGLTTPCESQSTTVTSNPSRSRYLAGSTTAGCSIAEMIRCPATPGTPCIIEPQIARLLLSVPPDVNTISSRSAPSNAATLLRASSIASRQACPKRGCLTDSRSVPSETAPRLKDTGGNRSRRVVVQINDAHAEHRNNITGIVKVPSENGRSNGGRNNFPILESPRRACSVEEVILH